MSRWHNHPERGIDVKRRATRIVPFAWTLSRLYFENGWTVYIEKVRLLLALKRGKRMGRVRVSMYFAADGATFAQRVKKLIK